MRTSTMFGLAVGTALGVAIAEKTNIVCACKRGVRQAKNSLAKAGETVQETFSDD